MVEEKILTLNLRKLLLKEPRWKRSKQLVGILKKVLKRYMKAERIKISKEVNEVIWAKGGRKPLAKLRLRIIKVGEKTYEIKLVK